LLGGRVGQFVGFTLDEVAEAVAPVQAAVPARCRRAGLRLRGGLISDATDVDHHGFAGRTEVFKNVADPLEIVQRDVIANVFVRRQQYRLALARADLKRPDPGVEIVRRQLAFEVLQTGLPEVLGHAVRRSVINS
jgi:hypothetical protein